MPRIDLLLTKPSKRKALRVGEFQKTAPYMMMTVEGETALMPLPLNVTSGNQVMWEQKDFTAGSATGASVLGSGLDIANLDIASAAKAGKSVWDNIGLIGGSKLSNLGALAGIDNAPDLFFHKKNVAVNPNKEMTFNGIGYRSFSFEFEFIPLDKKQAGEVADFIEFFQEKAMPDWADKGNKTFFQYPETWVIEWKNTTSLPVMLPCYLTDYSINYGAVGKMAQHVDGSPVQTNISLTFVEAELHMRHKIKEGYTG